MRLVVDESDNKYWVNINNLSDAPIPKNLIEKIYENAKGRKKSK